MNHILLTGATGLLGEYLLRDLTREGRPMAVLVRSNRRSSAAERVEAILQHWKPICGHLTAPKVLEGDITQTSLGLSDEDQHWAADNCSMLIHSAASLKFQPSGDEPWNSNLNGTRNALDFCEASGIPKLHYISTAYVCGKVDSVAFETTVHGTSEPRNVYEASKRQAEQLVMNSDLTDPPTILRPSIIIGDSQTGYTSTFHGPYLPLRLALSMLSPKVASEAGIRIGIDALRILKMMGLSGQERKNVVPVDWVSRCISRIVRAPELHGQIYHLTADRSLSVEVLTRMTSEFLNKAYGFDMADPVEFDPQLENYFTAQMSVYREYWADDPTFDATNRILALPDEPPPVIDEDMMRIMFQYVVDAEQQQYRVATS